MRITMNYMDKPTITVKDASWVLSLSTSTVKRKIDSGVLKCVKRDNLKEKILIYTDSLAKYIQTWAFFMFLPTASVVISHPV